MLAIKNARVGDFNGKTLSTGATSLEGGCFEGLLFAGLVWASECGVGVQAAPQSSCVLNPLLPCLSGPPCAAVGGTSVSIDPADIPEAVALRQWYDQVRSRGQHEAARGGHAWPLDACTCCRCIPRSPAAAGVPPPKSSRPTNHPPRLPRPAQGGAAVAAEALSRQGAGKSDRRICLAQIKEEGLGMGEKPDWVQATVCISYLRSESMCYPACTNKVRAGAAASPLQPLLLTARARPALPGESQR